MIRQIVVSKGYFKAISSRAYNLTSDQFGSHVHNPLTSSAIFFVSGLASAKYNTSDQYNDNLDFHYYSIYVTPVGILFLFAGCTVCLCCAFSAFSFHSKSLLYII